MSLFALGLVLTSAVFHATWNLFAKRAGDFPFLWLAFVIGAVVFAPFALAIVAVDQPQLTWIMLVFILVAVCPQTLDAGRSPQAIAPVTSRSCIRSRGRADRCHDGRCYRALQ